MENDKKYWLCVERYENWRTDKDNHFSFLGIGHNKRKLAERMTHGDLLITYVSSGYSSISDVREILSDGPKESRRGLVYDEPYRYEIMTKPNIILSEDKWVPIKEFVGKLSFLKPDKDWRQVFRHAIREIPKSDARLLLKRVSR